MKYTLIIVTSYSLAKLPPSLVIPSIHIRPFLTYTHLEKPSEFIDLQLSLKPDGLLSMYTTEDKDCFSLIHKSPVIQQG